MSRIKDVYEDLKEYVDIINARARETDDVVNERPDVSSDYLEGVKATYEKVEEELERILDGRGL